MDKNQFICKKNPVSFRFLKRIHTNLSAGVTTDYILLPTHLDGRNIYHKCASCVFYQTLILKNCNTVNALRRIIVSYLIFMFIKGHSTSYEYTKFEFRQLKYEPTEPAFLSALYPHSLLRVIPMNKAFIGCYQMIKCHIHQLRQTQSQWMAHPITQCQDS